MVSVRVDSAGNGNTSSTMFRRIRSLTEYPGTLPTAYCLQLTVAPERGAAAVAVLLSDFLSQ